jgi:hypothetical protein
MALGNIGPHLIYDQDGDLFLDMDRYRNVSVYCALERADMDLNREVFNQLMKGSRFFPLLHHMALTKELGMIWNYYKGNIFLDNNNVSFHVCDICKHYAPFKCVCKCNFYCSVTCQRHHWRLHKSVCSHRRTNK